MHMNLLKDVLIKRVENAASAAQTEVVTDVVDTQGYQSIAFIALLGDVTDGSVLTLTGKTNDEDSTSGAETLDETATFTAGASDADNKLLILDLHQPRQRYVFASLTRTSANAVVDGVIAILYNGRELPEALDASVIASAFVNDPSPA